ncbi:MULTISPECIES: TIGR00730 family Rossman fold protein [unclassified Moraxella]|uniref:LOG family protein n=1 Tax=unclassified Moraxella TaxID=2685852 RepID=UPI003AF8509A
MSQVEVITSKQISELKQVINFDSIEIPLVAVYCGSRTGNHPIYMNTAKALGEALVSANMGLVYGGAVIGCMGAVADGVIDAGGIAVGVIPEFMLGREIAHEGLTRLHLTDTMHTRKAIMAEYASAFITLPGGLGTLEEIMEIATWRQLYQHQKPMIILNVNGFYDHLVKQLQFTFEQGFMKQEDLNNLIICETVEQAVALLQPISQIPDKMNVTKI